MELKVTWYLIRRVKQYNRKENFWNKWKWKTECPLKKTMGRKTGRIWICSQSELKRWNLSLREENGSHLTYREKSGLTKLRTSLLEHQSAQHMQGNHCSLERRAPNRKRGGRPGVYKDQK